jgi:hypothetical protein
MGSRTGPPTVPGTNEQIGNRMPFAIISAFCVLERNAVGQASN